MALPQSNVVRNNFQMEVTLLFRLCMSGQCTLAWWIGLMNRRTDGETIDRQTEFSYEFSYETMGHVFKMLGGRTEGLRIDYALGCKTFCLSIRMFVCPSICLSVRLSICLSVRLSVSLSVRFSISLSVRLSVRPSIC